MSKYANTGNQPAKPRRAAILAARQSIEVTKPSQYMRGYRQNKVTGAIHGPMIVRIGTK